MLREIKPLRLRRVRKKTISYLPFPYREQLDFWNIRHVADWGKGKKSSCPGGTSAINQKSLNRI